MLDGLAEVAGAAVLGLAILDTICRRPAQRASLRASLRIVSSCSSRPPAYYPGFVVWARGIERVEVME
jgi:hypothetical protein